MKLQMNKQKKEHSRRTYIKPPKKNSAIASRIKEIHQPLRISSF